MRLAIVFDDLIQFGGAEKLLIAITEIWPDAPIYTTVMSDEWKGVLRGNTVHTSFLQKLPLREKLNRLYSGFLLHALAIESFDFSEYDIVLSVSARFAHGAITKPGTVHICYMNSPGRMFWEPFSYFENESLLKIPIIGYIAKQMLKVPLSILRVWDHMSSKRVDYFIANSRTPQARINKYYGMDSQIIYPFVEFLELTKNLEKYREKHEPYFLILSRLVSWKKIEIAIQACKELNINLKIAGSGPDEQRLKTYASSNTEFLGYVSPEEKKKLLVNCEALINTQFEDFGITPLEAMACGKPVLAFGAGGALETVVQGKTGEFFLNQDKESLKNALRVFDPAKYSAHECINQAEKFKKSIFTTMLNDFVHSVYLKNQ